MFICNAALRNKEMRANCSSSSACPANSSEEELPVGLEVYGNLELVFTVVSAVMIGLLMFSLGCSVEIWRLWSHIRRPWGIAVGLLCQFGLMPLTAYLLVINFSLKPVQAMAILIMGCCPGGTISNIFTYWVDGDMDLRRELILTHTDDFNNSPGFTVSQDVGSESQEAKDTVEIYYTMNESEVLTVLGVDVSESAAGITLVCLTIPVAFGVYMNYRWPKQSKIILKVGAIVGGVLLLVVAVAGVVLAKGSWNSDIILLTISFIFPLIGHVTGFLLALLTHQSWQRYS
ncbi:hypothetical protein J1605_022715 [Eschrichtius robustus]|uniref:Solute carrier family 10 member 6 n=1 Tax=Eschrichtius robustus TaxID=9764 RepID=A0AB34HAK3_ESCRO|nr:hypothetical protein J1605_022715 [Eschrichtius robustus]